jgi:BolA protein
MIEKILRETFAPTHLIIIDESHLHAGHNADAKRGGTHYRIEITSETLNALPLIERHRRVNAALKEAFANGLHALSLSFKK